MTPPRLAVYGTLAPGGPANHRLATVCGTWESGTVRARWVNEGWAVQDGYPALVLDPEAPPVPVSVFHSPDLHTLIEDIDAYEGDDYVRTQCMVTGQTGPDAPAWIYVLAEATHR